MGMKPMGKIAIIMSTVPHFLSYISTPLYSVISVGEGDLHQAAQARLCRRQALGNISPRIMDR